MGKDLKFTMLLDFYGEMLTEKQRNVIELYYDEDLSLSEIAESSKITRQGVHDSIKRGEQLLHDLEEKLGLVEKFLKYNELLDTIDLLAKEIYEESTTYSYPRTISNRAEEISKCVKESKEVV